jgi:hypothetical protein
MNSEFTAWCNDYYKLYEQLIAQDLHYQNLLYNPPPYTGQSNLHELDAILSHNHELQAAKTKLYQTFKETAAARDTVLAIMEFFEMPPNTRLTGQVPGEREYEIWADEHGALCTRKLKDLPPKPNNSCEIVIAYKYYDGTNWVPGPPEGTGLVFDGAPESNKPAG